MSVIEISIVVPVYNSSSTLDVLIERIKKAFENKGLIYEVILVDDRSTDQSWGKMNQLKLENECLTIVRLSKNFGQVNATLAGIEQAKGNFIVTMDDDLQYNPDDIIKLHETIKGDDFDLVCGFPDKKEFSAIANLWRKFCIATLRLLLKRKYRNIMFYSSFKIYSSSLFFENNEHIFKPHNILNLLNYDMSRCSHINVKHFERVDGQSSYNFAKRFLHFLPVIFFIINRSAYYLFFTFTAIGILVYILQKLTIVNTSHSLIFYFSIGLTFLVLKFITDWMIKHSFDTGYIVDEVK